MAVDFDLKCYFTPNFTPGFPNPVVADWYRPWQLAYLNIAGGGDTTPEIYQYIPGQRFENGLRLEVDTIELVRTLDQGSWAHIDYTTVSDRDVFEVVDNEGSGHMLPRMKFPYRAWEINLKAKADSSFPSPALFRGMLTQAAIQTKSDLKIAGQQDGVFTVKLDFESYDSFNLRKDIGAPLWYHRENSTTDGYHWGLFAFDSINIDTIITKIVSWMNKGRPTSDFPQTFSYTPKGVSPYTLNIFDPVPKSMTGTATFTNGSSAVTGTGTLFTAELAPGQLIAPDANITGADRLIYANWGKISSITDDTHLTLTANYQGTTGTNTASSGNVNTAAISECKDKGTWEILRDVLNYMGALEGLGKKYIPSCDISGVLDVTHGGYDKTASPYTDFRTSQVMEKNTSTDMTSRFNLVQVTFTGTNDAEYWIKFTLYRKNGAEWDTVLNVPANGYEYVPYDEYNTHGQKFYSFVTQEIIPEDTYKWDADLVTAGGFRIAATGSLAFSPASYNFLNSPTKIRYDRLRTFIMTQGKCSQLGIYHSSTNAIGCVDGGTVAGGGNNKCPDQHGCYPDYLASPSEPVNAKYGIMGLAASFSNKSNQNNWNTLCRLNSKRIYECSLNTDSSIREPFEVEIEFKDGYTGELVGRYLDIYSPELDDVIMVRCTEQSHFLQGKRLKTTIKGFRV